MERKIGEIFEIGGEWYQCVKGIGCFQCVFNRTLCVRSNISRDIIGNCSKNTREDGYAVIFKKLEKVGEPFFVNIQGNNVLEQRYKLYEPMVTLKEYWYRIDGNFINIEIQTKEDMEEKKLNLKPFDLEKAKEGKPVCTRDGRKARIICFNRNDLYPIVALIECEDGKEIVEAYSNEGQTEIYEIKGKDLMMLPEKKEGWVNIYDDMKMYASEERAKIGISTERNYIATTKVEWEE